MILQYFGGRFFQIGGGTAVLGQNHDSEKSVQNYPLGSFPGSCTAAYVEKKNKIDFCRMILQE